VTPMSAIYVLWGAWFVSWLLASVWSAPIERRASRPATELAVRFLTAAGVVLVLFPFARQRFAEERLWHVDEMAGWLLVAAAAAGFVFAWWGRIYLGRLWSAAVVKKVGHRVVDSGPYRLVRHPIYTGLILSALATAAARGTATSLLGAVIMTLALFVKARIEERFLRAELGANAYDYARRVPMLVPWT
jgi:protein-S-isoprenylcysteine O-methyltransferase Ste14